MKGRNSLKRKQEKIKSKKTRKKTAHKTNTQIEYADLRARNQRGGGVAPRRKNGIRHQGEQGSEKKSAQGGTGNKRKTTTNEKEGENGDLQNGEKKTKKKKKGLEICER